MASLRDFSKSASAGESTPQNGADTRLDVELDQTDPLRPTVRLRQQSWAPGMGWFTQKTISLEAAHLPGLLYQMENALAETKLLRSSLHHETTAPTSSARREVIRFPIERAARPSEFSGDEERGQVLPFRPRRGAQ